MPIQQTPKFKSTPDKMLEIAQPAIGGLNLKDLEFEQEVNQSPYMLNMMYRNGAFGKRYGQTLMQASDGDLSMEDEIYAITTFGGYVIIHAGTKIYKFKEGEDPVEIGTGFNETRGLFIVYAQKLYYLISNGFYQYKENFEQVEPYIPEVIINCKPDGTYGGDVIDDFNLLGTKFKIIYNGESGVTEYKVEPYDSEKLIDWSVRPTILVDDEETNDFTVDTANKKITFTTAPSEGNLNVEMTFTMVPDTFDEQKTQILSSKFYDTFGGANNSRLFLAGSGNSRYFYSSAYDITYFPENNSATLGNTEEDITGFGRQYNVLIVFKPREIYSIYSYTQTSATTVLEEEIGLEGFRSQLVNARIGCDAPYTVQVINNYLTWYNSREGICTLVSTNIQDERNVRLISRNINKANSFGIDGVLDHEEDLNSIQSADFDNKYFLCFPECGTCYIWDYEISPFRYSSSGETDPRKLDWFVFDHFYVKEFLKNGKELIYSSTNSFSGNIVKLTDSFADLDYDNDGEPDAISSYYMTPFMQFGAVEYLKNVKNIYVQCRGDTSSVIDMYYYTEENVIPEQEPESIRIGGKLWEHFRWDNFQWLVVNWANTFRRKCNLKKIQMASFYFCNDEVNRDMSITHIGLQYQIVKNVR